MEAIRQLVALPRLKTLRLYLSPVKVRYSFLTAWRELQQLRGLEKLTVVNRRNPEGKLPQRFLPGLKKTAGTVEITNTTGRSRTHVGDIQFRKHRQDMPAAEMKRR